MKTLKTTSSKNVQNKPNYMKLDCHPISQTLIKFDNKIDTYSINQTCMIAKNQMLQNQPRFL